MTSLSFILTFLSTFSWTSESVCDFLTVEAHPGDEATLWCSNLSRFPAHMCWFKQASHPSCISSMVSSDSNVSVYEGIQPDKYIMTSNTTNIFLHIKSVDFSDSGLYFCGVKSEFSTFSTPTYLQVQDVCKGCTNLPAVILGGATLLLLLLLIIIVISMVIKVRTYHAAQTSRLHQDQNLDSDALNYAALSFHPRSESSSRPVAERELEINQGVYAATR